MARLSSTPAAAACPRYRNQFAGGHQHSTRTNPSSLASHCASIPVMGNARSSRLVRLIMHLLDTLRWWPAHDGSRFSSLQKGTATIRPDFQPRAGQGRTAKQRFDHTAILEHTLTIAHLGDFKTHCAPLFDQVLNIPWDPLRHRVEDGHRTRRDRRLTVHDPSGIFPSHQDIFCVLPRSVPQSR